MFLYHPKRNQSRECAACEAAEIIGSSTSVLYRAMRRKKPLKCGWYVFRNRPTKTTLTALYAAEVHEGEEWRSFRGSAYYVSSAGRVKCVANGEDRFIRPNCQHRSGAKVGLYLEGKRIWISLNRMLAEAFELPRRTGDDCVRHVNGETTDYRVSNLAWGRRADVVKRARRTRQKTVVQLDANGEAIACFPSATKAAEALFISVSTVWRYCSNKVKEPAVRLMWEIDYEECEEEG